MRIVVVGGGIGGLATCATLARAGHEVHLLEREARFAPVGAGIVLAANAMRVLAAVGAEVVSRAHRLERMDVVDRQGRTLQALEVGRLAVGAGYTVERPLLHEALLAALPEAVQIETSVRDVVLEERSTGVLVRYGVGAQTRALEADLVVGADGLRSRVRTQLFGEMPVRYSGVTCWRGIVEGIALDRAIEAWGGRSRVGVVPLAAGRVYYFLVRGAPRRAAEPTLETLRQDFSGFEGEVGRVIDAALAAERPPLHHDLEELEAPVWGRGRVLLLGDAAHAMTPNQGQGAAMALEDAVALQRALEPGVEGALERYVAVRASRVRRVQLDSRRLGELAHWESPLACAVRDGLLRMVPQRVSDAQVTRLVTPGLALAGA